MRRKAGKLKNTDLFLLGASLLLAAGGPACTSSPGNEKNTAVAEDSGTEIREQEEPGETPEGEKVILVNKLAGTWWFEDSSFYGESKLIFSEDMVVTMQMLFPDMENPAVMQGSYVVDYSGDPVHLDINWEGLGSVQTIIRFIGQHKLQLQNNELDLERPADFTDDSAILIRREE